MSERGRVVGAVTGLWILIGIVLASQTALGMTLQGEPISLSNALRTSFINALPWIPSTLTAIWVASRFPITRDRWKRSLPVHLVALPMLDLLANVGVVLGFWWDAGAFQGPRVLAEQSLFWATQRFQFAAVVYGATVAATQFWRHLGASRERELHLARLEGQLANARLSALNEQIRPHFLFNTLHTIGQMWRAGRADEADAMLDSLGALFQRVQTSTDQSAITLDEELTMVEDYLAIEQARLPDRLVTRIEASDEARSCLVLPLLLQPLVENAVRHGISVPGGGGEISVSAAVREGRLVVTVADDGPGLEGASPSAGTGTGLSNTRDRLAHVYGDDHDFDLSNGSVQGTLVTMEIPASTDVPPTEVG